MATPPRGPVAESPSPVSAPPPSAAPVSAEARKARQRLDSGRAEIFDRHRAGAGGQQVVRAISDLTDAVLQEMFASLASEYGSPSDLALVATGGYGRRELSPRSDVDLLALLPSQKADPARKERAEAVAESVHRALWDAGLEAGFGARTLEETLALARDDHTARTALLDCRLVVGDAALFKELERAVVTDLDARKIEEFIGEKLDELRGRRSRYGGSVWLLEPHIKQGKGGLRDLQAALWIARARHKVAGLGESGERGLLPLREVHAARAARDWLWKLRNELHYATGRRDDRLTFDNQRRLASALGYEDAEGELGVEKLMRETYIALQEIARASDALIDRCAVEDAPRPAGFFGPRRAPQAKPIDNAFKLWQGRVTVNDREVFARRPADLIRLFTVAETYGVPVYSYARDLLVQEMHKLEAGLAADRDAHFELWQYLVREGSDGSALGSLHELGVLGALFPELGRLRARAQHSLYHVYTVDTHTVVALQRMMRLRAGSLVEEEPDLTRIARAQERPLVLMLGLLFHDLGKGLGPDHSSRGAELVRAYAQRVALDPADAEDIAWLVQEHLKASHLSQRRDLEDVAMIEGFARDARTVERLEMLYLLTYADMASVSAENWTDWKAGLLRLLYEKTRATITAEGLDRPAHADSLEHRRERLIKAVEPLVDAAHKARVAAFARVAPERYLAITRAPEAARHVRLWTLAQRTGFAAELRRPSGGEADLTLVAKDRPGLLALFSAALAANGIDVLAAEVHTLGDLALDEFVVRETGGGVPSTSRWEGAHADLLRLLSGDEDPHKLVQRRLRRASWAASAVPQVATKLRLDDVSSAESTILDVFTQDRPGLLHAIAEALHAAGVSIVVARIATEGNRATDAFYLREAGGQAGRLVAEARKRAVENAVRMAIDELAGRS